MSQPHAARILSTARNWDGVTASTTAAPSVPTKTAGAAGTLHLVGRCEACSRSFFKAESYARHMATHDVDRPFHCDVCGKRFATRTTFARHANVHADSRPHVCAHCGKTFKDPTNLGRHVRTHTERGQYKCSMCVKSFNDRSNMQRHERAHSGEQPYACDFCGRRFIESHSMAAHRRLHTGETPFVCPTCGKRFSGRNNFTRHKRAHLEQLSHQCPHCDRAFRDARALVCHQAVHGSQDRPCPHCDELHPSDVHLQRHIRRVHDIVPEHGCQLCPQLRFARRAQLDVHMFHSHSVQVPPGTRQSVAVPAVTAAADDVDAADWWPSQEAATTPLQLSQALTPAPTSTSQELAPPPLRFSEASSQSRAGPSAVVRHDDCYYPCRVCPCVCATEADLSDHLSLHTPPSPRSPQGRPPTVDTPSGDIVIGNEAVTIVDVDVANCITSDVMTVLVTSSSTTPRLGIGGDDARTFYPSPPVPAARQRSLPAPTPRRQPQHRGDYQQQECTRMASMPPSLSADLLRAGGGSSSTYPSSVQTQPAWNDDGAAVRLPSSSIQSASAVGNGDGCNGEERRVGSGNENAGGQRHCGPSTHRASPDGLVRPLPVKAELTVL